jgi:hypothetical protein
MAAGDNGYFAGEIQAGARLTGAEWLLDNQRTNPPSIVKLEPVM